MSAPEVTGAVEKAATVLRDSSLINICGDDRGCQCEQAVEYSQTAAYDMLDAALDVDHLASVTHTAVTFWKADREAYGLDPRDYDLGRFVAACLRAAILGGAA